MNRSTKQLTGQCPAFCAGPGTSLFDRTSSTDWQYAAAHALSCFSLRLSLWMAVCAVFRLSAAHLPQYDLRHATHVPRCHCHGI